MAEADEPQDGSAGPAAVRFDPAVEAAIAEVSEHIRPDAQSDGDKERRKKDTETKESDDDKETITESDADTTETGKASVLHVLPPWLKVGQELWL